MIYFDNAATSRPKPEAVYDAFNYYTREVGTSPGRGSYKLAIQASRMLYQSRKTVASFFNAPNPSNVVFTKNSTEAINFFFNGYLTKKGHVLISPYEHNSVLRTIQSLSNKGLVDYTVLPEKAIYDSDNDLSKYIKPNTVLAAITLASNLTGQVVFNKSLSERIHNFGIPVFVDASQGAGKMLVDMQRDSIDYLSFTGHKDLLALPGVGGFVSKEAVVIPPLLQGGTGIFGDSYVNPEAFPDSYEAGTLNMPAIWSLKVSLDYIVKNHKEIAEKETELLSYFISQISNDPRIIIYNKDYDRVPTFCFNIDGVPSSEVVEQLSERDICVRGGIHCAIKAHETIGTVSSGAVRVSLNFFNEKSEIDEFINMLKGI